jgi:hypothetical protein
VSSASAPGTTPPRVAVRVAGELGGDGGPVAVVREADHVPAAVEEPVFRFEITLGDDLVAVDGTFNGPAQVTGGPGAGKTVVALHR